MESGPQKNPSGKWVALQPKRVWKVDEQLIRAFDAPP